VKYKAVLFDMDGVILDSEPLHYQAAKLTFKDHGHNLSYADYKKYFGGQTDKEGIAQYCNLIGIGRQSSEVARDKAQNYLKVASTANFVACPGSLELIQWLADNKTPLALVTGSLWHEAQMVLQAFNITELFSAVVAAEDVEHGKPHPAGYQKGAKALGVEAPDCLVIEDAPSGINAARSAGMDCLAVTTTYAAEELAAATKIVNQLHYKHLLI
jgi:beta-phosphoglucomutase-like phosphatase (HAD superfamily)